jgi:DNA-directed RNA polymerase subunit beta
VSGTVIGAQVFARKGIDKDERAQAIEEEQEARLLKDQNDEIKIIQESARRKIIGYLKNKSTSNRVVDDKGEVILKRGDTIPADLLEQMRPK